MPKRPSHLETRGPFRTTLFKYQGKGGWVFAPVPKKHAPPVTRPWGRTPVVAIVDGHEWATSVWRDSKSDRSLLAVPSRIRGAKGHGDRVTVELSFDPMIEEFSFLKRPAPSRRSCSRTGR